MENLLQAAVDANMNLLRVWGGGVYQSDDFYDMADEMGLMIWEEFMFACSLYPRDASLLSSIELEVKHQVALLFFSLFICVRYNAWDLILLLSFGVPTTKMRLLWLVGTQVYNLFEFVLTL